MKNHSYNLQVDKRLELGASNEFIRYIRGIEEGREVTQYLSRKYKWFCPSCGVEIRQSELDIEGRCRECGEILENY